MNCFHTSATGNPPTLVGQHPVIFQVGDFGLVAHGNADRTAVARVRDPMPHAGAAACVNLQRKVRDRKTPIVMRNRVRGRFDPIEQLLARKLHGFIGQGNFDFSARDGHDSEKGIGLLSLHWGEEKKQQ